MQSILQKNGFDIKKSLDILIFVVEDAADGENEGRVFIRFRVRNSVRDLEVMNFLVPDYSGSAGKDQIFSRQR